MANILPPQDLQVANVLFHRELGILLRNNSEPVGRRSLDVRIIDGLKRSIGVQRVRWTRVDRVEKADRESSRPPTTSPTLENAQVLRIYISSPSDPLLLYTLDCDEDGFRQLQSRQAILVDYPSFGGKLVSLLERCIACSHEADPRWDGKGLGIHVVRC